MANIPVRNAEYYRARAEECRAIAEDLLGAEPKRLMLKNAEDYEQMAIVAMSISHGL